MTMYCKHGDNIVQYEKHSSCRLCALEKEVSALAKENYKLRESLVVKDHEAALQEESNKSAVALVDQINYDISKGMFVAVGTHLDELKRLLARPLPLANNGINSDSPRLRTGNPSPEGFMGYETDEPQ